MLQLKNEFLYEHIILYSVTSANQYKILHMKNLLSTLLLLIYVFVLSLPNLTAQAIQITIDFTNPVPTAPTACDQTWTEEGIEIFASNLNDYGCDNFSYPGTGGISLSPGALTFDLFGLGNIISISGTVTNLCGQAACSSISYYEGTTVVGFSYVSTGVTTPYDFTYQNTAENHIDKAIFLTENGILNNITIEYEPYDGCEPKPEIYTIGDIYLRENCHGIIMTSPNGSCFRIRVEDDGTLKSELITCPQN